MALTPFLKCGPPQGLWVRRTREALLLSQKTCAVRAGLTIDRWRWFERSEANKNISLLHLETCARAMDCELIYAFRPKENIVFSERIWQTGCRGEPEISCSTPIFGGGWVGRGTQAKKLVRRDIGAK